MWLLTGSELQDGKTIERPMVPHLTHYTLANTVSSPSVLAFRAWRVFFDENLIWLMDVELYASLGKIW